MRLTTEISDRRWQRTSAEADEVAKSVTHLNGCYYEQHHIARWLIAMHDVTKKPIYRVVAGLSELCNLLSSFYWHEFARLFVAYPRANPTPTAASMEANCVDDRFQTWPTAATRLFRP